MPDFSPSLLRSCAAIVRVQGEKRGQAQWIVMADVLTAHAATLEPPETPANRTVEEGQ